MVVISMKLVVFGSILLRIWIVVLLGPSDHVSHVLHDSHALNWLYVEIIFRNLSTISLRSGAHSTA